MRIGGTVVFSGLILLAGTASAQTLTTAELQALAVQDAQQYGVPTNLFVAQIQAESGFNPNAVNSATGATGVAQFLPSTAANPGYGIATFNPSDPTASLAAAAQYDAALQQADGSWMAALTAYSGGLTPNNPGDYGAVFADAAIADGGGTVAASSGGAAAPATPGITVTGGSTVGSTAASAPSQLANFFVWLNTELTQATAANVQTLTTTIQNAIGQGGLIALLTLAFAFYFMRIARTAYSRSDIIMWFLTAGTVYLFVSTSSTYYNDYVAAPISNAPTWIANVITPGATSPAATFSAVWDNNYALMLQIDAETSGWWAYLKTGIELDFALLVMGFGLILMYIPFAIAQLLLEVLSIVGPIIIPFALFEPLKHIVWKWISHIIALLLTAVGINVLLSMFGQILTDMIGAAAASGNPDVDRPGFWGASIIVLLLGLAAAYLSRLMVGIAGAGVAVAMEAAARGAVAPLAAAGAAAVGGAAAAGAATAMLGGSNAASPVAAFRAFAPVGASLSRGLV